MENKFNAQTFIDHLRIDKKVDEDLIKLTAFASCSKLYRQVGNRYPFMNKITNVSNDWKEYIFNYKEKEYPFSVFRDKKLQKCDKDMLKSHKRNSFRLLKLACSMDLVNPRIVVGNSIVNPFNILLLFEENGIDKVIDYSRNLVMNKLDYYEIFEFNEINVVDKLGLYNIYCVILKLEDYDHIFEYLIFTKEIFRELSKKDGFHFLKEKYDSDGFHQSSHTLYGDKSDCVFFQREDMNHVKYQKIREELDAFTENLNPTKHIKYLKKKEKYILREKSFGYFTFGLLSDMVDNDEIKDKLLSQKRYHECHDNSIIVAKALKQKDKSSAYVVGGKIKVNEIDYFYHSWVEIDDKNVVIDFNHNLVMNRDKYYKLYGAVAISKTLISEMEEIIQTVVLDADLNLHSIYLNYFGSEMMNDLKKNEKVFKKDM